MSVGTVTPRGRKISVEFDHSLADAIDAAAAERSTAYRRMTVSDIVREAVARFLLPSDGRDTSHNGTETTTAKEKAGSLS